MLPNDEHINILTSAFVTNNTYQLCQHEWKIQVYLLKENIG